MYHVKALFFFVHCWITQITCQMAPVPFGLENLLFGGLGSLPPPQPMAIPIGIENFFGPAQYSPSFGMPPPMGGFSMGPLPFPLFPMPCDVICEHGGLFFANINVQNPQQTRPGMSATGGISGMPGAGVMPGMPGAGAMSGGLPGGGMPTTMRPGGAASPGAGAMGAGATGARPGVGSPTGMPGGTQPTRPPGMPTTLPTGAAAQMMMAQQRPNVNAQIMYFYPNW